MKNVMKFVFGLVFSLGFFVSANAQTDSAGSTEVPSPDDIMCVQVAENVFECSVADPNFGREDEDLNQGTEGTEQEPSEDLYNEGAEGQDQYGTDSLNQDEMNQGSQQEDLFKEGTTEEEKRNSCERILNEDQSKGNEFDQDLNNDQDQGNSKEDDTYQEEQQNKSDQEMNEEGSFNEESGFQHQTIES